MQNNQITRFNVGIGAVCIYSGEAEMIAYALGSCIALCLYDRVTATGALAHILLPSKSSAPSTDSRYADAAINIALNRMYELGSKPYNITAAIVGGAKMFSFGNAETLNIGEMNIRSVTEELDKHNIRLVYSEVGGIKSRTVHFFIPGNGYENQILIGRGSLTAVHP